MERNETKKWKEEDERAARWLPPTPPAAGQGGRGAAPCSRRVSESRRKKQKGGRERRGSRGTVLNAVAGGRRSRAAALGAVAGEVPCGTEASGACEARGRNRNGLGFFGSTVGAVFVHVRSTLDRWIVFDGQD